MTVRVYSDQAGTTAAAANDNIGKVEDLSKFDSDGVSSTTGPYLSVDANGFGSADILGQGGDVVQTFTNAIAGGSALVVGTSKCIFFSNVNVEAGGTLTIGPAGDMINTNGLNLIGKVVSVATTTKVLTTAEQNSIATFFAERGASSVVVNDETVYDVNSVEADLVLDFNGSSFYRNVPHYFKLGGTYSTFADAFTGNSPKLTYGATSNSTMVNSSGEIVWAPHNLEPDSNDITNYNVLIGASIIDSETFTTSGSSGDALTGRVISSADLNATYTVRAQIWSETDAGTAASFGVRTIGITDDVKSITLQSTPTWEELESDITGATQFRGIKVASSSAATIKIRNISVYRSDLGGMAPVPGAVGDFQYYVPTNGAAEYLPRVGHHVYNGSAWVNEGLLIESEPRTNLLEHSADLANPYYSKASSRTEVLSSAELAPDGVSTAEIVQAITGSATGEQYARKNLQSLSGDVTASIFVKKKNWRYIVIRSANSQSIWDFDTASFTLEGTDCVLNAEDFGNGWYRLSVTSPTIASNFVTVGTAGSSTAVSWSSAPTNNEGVYVWGFQAENAPTPSSYIPTSGSTVTRGGQSLTVPANWYDADNPTYTGPELFVSAATSDPSVVDNGDGSYTFSVTGGANASVVVADALTDGAVYRVAFTLSDWTSGNLAVSLQAWSNGGQYNANGTYETFVVAASGDDIRLDRSGSTVTGTVSNISVRQVSAPQFGWPEPEYIGPELVVDGSGDNWVGDFDSSNDVSSWSNDGTSIISHNASGYLDIDRNGSSVDAGKRTAEITISGLTVGKTYAASADVIALSHGFSITVQTISYGSVSDGDTVNATGSYSHTFVATQTSHVIGLGARQSTAASVTVDNISVREINPLSVSIQMDGRMTYADNASFQEFYFVDWYFNGDNYIRSRIDTDYGGTGACIFLQKQGGVAQIVQQPPNSTTPGVLVPFNISSRHGSTFVNGAVDGVALTANTTPTALPDLSGTDLQIAQDFMGTIGTFRQFAGDIGDTGLVTATKPSTEPTLSLTFDGTGGSFYNLNWSE